jgi:hypothetical protein
MKKKRNIARTKVAEAERPWLAWLFRQNALARSLLVWLTVMLVLQAVFYLAAWTHPEAWQGVAVGEVERGWPWLGRALLNNGFILAAIIIGNLFVRFGPVTPGLIILTIQALTIGWVAGTNSFVAPFPSIAAANAAFLRIGLWETSAYAIAFAVTFPKSLLVSATFPAREWMDKRALSDALFTPGEIALMGLSLLMLVGAAIVEAFG